MYTDSHHTILGIRNKERGVLTKTMWGVRQKINEGKSEKLRKDRWFQQSLIGPNYPSQGIHKKYSNTVRTSSSVTNNKK